MIPYHILPAITLLLAAPMASAQRADEDVVTTADDAFGASLGRESFGIYSPLNVRGFSPEAAGNTRIEGLFFDQRAGLTGRVRLGSAIRVGLTAIGYPFPAPTGVVDISLRIPGDKLIATVAGGLSDNFGQFAESDIDVPLAKGLAINMGAGIFLDENGTSSGGDFLAVGGTLRWNPTADTRLILFAGQSEGWNDQVGLALRVTEGGLPPRISRTRFAGPDWAIAESSNSNMGAIVGADLATGLRLDAGLFRSVGTGFGSATSIASGFAPDRTADRLVILRAPTRDAGWSGEARLAYSLSEGPRRHRLILLGRGRSTDTRFGGDQPVPLGRFPLDARINPPEPAVRFGPQTENRIRQTTIGLGYAGSWGRWLELSAGVQRTDYQQTVLAPGRPEASRRDRPWLLNSLAGITLSPKVALYAGFTEGLEESGIAPDNAVNRGEVLPALRTEQMEAGARFVLPGDLRLVTGLFRIDKPYFAIDEFDLFRERGIVRHQGLEVSLSGSPLAGLTLLAGGVFLDASVAGPEVDEGLIGPRPIGRARETAILAIDWRPDPAGPWSFDLFADAAGKRVATRDNATLVPAFARPDLGFRYRTSIAGNPATARLQLVNAINGFNWQVRGDGFYSPNQPRTIRANLTVDL